MAISAYAKRALGAIHFVHLLLVHLLAHPRDHIIDTDTDADNNNTDAYINEPSTRCTCRHLCLRRRPTLNSHRRQPDTKHL